VQPVRDALGEGKEQVPYGNQSALSRGRNHDEPIERGGCVRKPETARGVWNVENAYTYSSCEEHGPQHPRSDYYPNARVDQQQPCRTEGEHEIDSRHALKTCANDDPATDAWIVFALDSALVKIEHRPHGAPHPSSPASPGKKRSAATRCMVSRLGFEALSMAGTVIARRRSPQE